MVAFTYLILGDPWAELGTLPIACGCAEDKGRLRRRVPQGPGRTL
jgi:hypothetical protein